MREEFEALEVEMVEFDDEDVITTSQPWCANETESGA